MLASGASVPTPAKDPDLVNEITFLQMRIFKRCKDTIGMKLG
jgi:hypothetical protein